MPKPKSHKARAAAMLEALGYEVFDVEVQGRFGHLKLDLLGFGDLLGLRNGETVAIQATAGDRATGGGDVATHVTKMLNEPKVLNALAACLRAGWKVEIWGVRHKPAENGSLVKSRFFVLECSTETSDQVVAYEGSQILT